MIALVAIPFVIIIPTITYFVVRKKCKYANSSDRIFVTLLSFLGSIIIAATLGLIAQRLIVVYGDPTIKNIPIYSLDRGSDTSGSFFLGTGSVNSSPVYFYYYGVGRDSYQLGRSNAMRVSLTMDSTQKPHIELYDHVCWGSFCVQHSGEVRIVVPDDTIKRKFKVN